MQTGYSENQYLGCFTLSLRKNWVDAAHENVGRKYIPLWQSLQPAYFRRRKKPDNRNDSTAKPNLNIAIGGIDSKAAKIQIVVE